MEYNIAHLCAYTITLFVGKIAKPNIPFLLATVLTPDSEYEDLPFPSLEHDLETGGGGSSLVPTKSSSTESEMDHAEVDAASAAESLARGRQFGEVVHRTSKRPFKSVPRKGERETSDGHAFVRHKI